MGQSWNLSGRTALATLAGLAVLEGTTGHAWAGPAQSGAAPPPAAVVASSSGRVSVDFVDADLGDVVKALSIQSGVNVVLAADTKGKVTVRLKGTTLEEALRLITSRLDNFDFKKINGAYVIGTTDSLRALARRSGISQAMTPHSITPSDAKEVAQGASAYVDVTVQARTGQIVLRGLPEDVTAAHAAVEAADASALKARATSQGAPQTKVLKSANPKALADLLTRTVPELKCSVRELGVIITGTSDELARADEVKQIADDAGGAPHATRLYPLKYLHPTEAQKCLEEAFPDQGGKKVLIVMPGPEALAPNAGSFMPLSVDNQSFKSQTSTSNAGSNGTGSSNGQTKSRVLVLIGEEGVITAATALLDQLDVAPPQVMIEARVVESSPETLKNIGLQWDFGTSGVAELPHGTHNPGVNVGVLTRPPINFTAQINALVQNTQAKVLADPKIAVIDGEDASIFIGDTIRYRVLSSVSTGGQQVFDVKEVPIGIVLLVRPRVNTDGMVTLKVNPVVSTVTAFVGPEQLPQTASREANSTIRVHDGDTVAIGGLIRDEDRQTLSKVPILGDLPLVGQLFRNNNHDRKRTDVTIFLTTHLMKG
jgi:general secretion pathway protein D